MKIVFLSVFLFSSLFAHKLNLFLFEEKDKVYISSYFASGTSCKNCKLKIYDLNKKIIEEAKTDEQGEYIIKIIQSKMIIKVEAIGGHAVEKEFEIKSIKEKREEIKESDSIFESILAIFLIFLIFFFLKRIKK